MELKSDFSFRPLPDIKRPLRFSLETRAAVAAAPLGPLQDLPGTWTGKGFNVIWRPNSAPGEDHFLELNLTEEILEIEEVKGPIPNRGLLQPDINMFGVTYLQQIKDANNKAGLHIEPGIWASVPQTENPAEAPTVVRMASIPHGTTILAQGLATEIAGRRKSQASTSRHLSSGQRRKFRFQNPISQSRRISARHLLTLPASLRAWWIILIRLLRRRSWDRRSRVRWHW